MHEHKKPKECKHELKHCTHCDVVYCSKCQREWGKDTVDDWMKRMVQVENKNPDYEPLPKPYWKENIMLCKHE